MMPRRLPPVSSPVTARLLAAGLRGALGGDRSDAHAVESLLRSHFGVAAVRATSSGTAALTLAIRASAARTGRRRVALPAWACYDLATAADGADAEVALYDLDPATLGPEPESFRRALEREPGAVVVVHLFGLPVGVPALAASARGAGAVLIEDAAQGAGGWLGARRLGAHGELAVLSFGRGKGMSAGAGGAVLADEAHAPLLESIAQELPRSGRGWKPLGVLAAMWALGRPGQYALPASLPFLRLGETIYRPPAPPRAIIAAGARMVPEALRLMDAAAERRAGNAARLAAAAAEREWSVPAVMEGARAGWLRLPLVARRPRDVRRAARLGVMPGYPKALADLEGFTRRIVNRDDAFEGARALARRLVTVPTHGLLEERDLVALERWLAGRGSD